MTDLGCMTSCMAKDDTSTGERESTLERNSTLQECMHHQPVCLRLSLIPMHFYNTEQLRNCTSPHVAELMKELSTLVPSLRVCGLDRAFSATKTGLSTEEHS